MQRYEGTKRLRATPTTRGEYNAYRGWETPANENPADRGFLVEYEDGGKANDSRHGGYISWSPADVFERSYRPIPEDDPALQPHQHRVVHEKAELDDRLGKLLVFMTQNPLFEKLDRSEQARLQQQAQLMTDLSGVLKQRIAAF